ncbi:hypothetical protein RND71_014315 [Anisodus tanguticus]|uniref:Uncharacterized protein n=1 Tax=Anisodus tanguticus TaxID=243964 RepID=A0AAE1SAG8_9SOLA|nr:hypothetical protein RND71_014315 [Anisodus tanguticus]
MCRNFLQKIHGEQPTSLVDYRFVPCPIELIFGQSVPLISVFDWELTEVDSEICSSRLSSVNRSCVLVIFFQSYLL